MIFYKIIYIILFLIIIYLKFVSVNENFKNKNIINKNTMNKYNIWMYWESKIGYYKPTYLNLCYKTIIKNCRNNCNIFLLNEKTIYNYLPELRLDLNKKCNIPQKADYIRLSLLKKYGGIWLDADIIVFKPLDKLFSYLEKYDFIGFGCHYKNCNETMDGYLKPANWVIGSIKNGKLVSNCLKEADHILDYNYNKLKVRYHCLGRELLWNEINKLSLNDKKWKYYHFSSKCIERDSFGNKLVNKRLISNENIDLKCKNDLLFVPIYNTAPGFPNWFLKMNENQLLNSNMLFSKFINYALYNNNLKQ